MKKHVLLSLLSVFLVFGEISRSIGQTTLAVGDLVILGVNTDNEDFTFLLLTDIDAGTEIYFTDNETNTATSINTGEGLLKYTAPTFISCGTVVGLLTNSSNFSTEEGSFTLGNSGDEVIAFQGYNSGTRAVTTFLHAVSDATISPTPSGLSSATLIDLSSDNGEYTGTTTGTKASLYSSVNTLSNWTQNNSFSSTTLSTNMFTVTDCAPPSSDTEVNFTSATSTVSEDGTSVQVCVGITNESATATTVSLNLTGGSATNGSDYFSNSGLTTSFSSSQTITFPSSSSSDQCVTVYINDDSSTESDETITFSLTGASGGTNATVGSTDQHTVTITDDDAPVITTSTGSLSGFSTSEGTPSTEQTFTISGDNLSGNLSLGAVSGFEYSLNNSTYTSTLSIPVSGGNVTGEPLTVYVRLTGTSQGSYSGNATISGGGATSVNVALDGSVNPPPAAPCADLFISEYVEGSSNNKYIEIYNPTASAIDLAAGNYSLSLYTNGSSSASNNALSGTIPAYGVMVFKNSSASVYTGPPAATTNNSVNFSGDDAVALVKNGTAIDIFGRIGDDPGSAWTSGGNTTANQTLVRNAAVQAGIDVNPTGTGAGAFTTLATEWTQYSIDDVSDLGSHTCDCYVANPEATLSINVTSGTEAAGTSITLTVATDVNVTGAQTVDIILSGTGLTASDFSGVNFGSTVTVTIPNGNNQGTVSFTVNDDADVEGPETATFTLNNQSSGLNIGTPASVTLDIADNDNLTSYQSAIVGQGGEAASISSLTNGTITSSSQGTQVWQFRLHDGDGSSNDADSKSTVYQQFTIRQSVGNTVPAWDVVIDNVKFFLGASTTPISGSFLVSPSTISFTPTTPITVADNGFAAISMRITLDASLPAGTDGQHLGFSIDDADVTVDTDVLTYSQLGTFTETSNAALNGIDITATLQFIDAPATVSVGSNFSITVSAIDANGNIDTDETALVTLTQTGGSGTLSGLTSANLLNGTYTFTGLNHDTEETIQVTASASGYSSVNASINVVDQPHQLFDDFNRADNSVIGIPSSGGSTSWTEDEAGDGTKVRIFNGQLMLDNCVESPPTTTSGGTTTELVAFNVSSYFETTYDDAGGPLEWLFNMRSNNSNLSGFAGSSYGMGFVLGCNLADFTAIGATGYAVVVGNSGTTDYIKLVHFVNGLANHSNPNPPTVITDLVSSDIDIDADHASVRVSFDPCTGQWTLYARNDGSSFTAPDVDSPAFSGPFTVANTDYTNLDLRYFGALWKHNSSCLGNDAYFDNFSIPTATTASTTARIWNGSVNADWNEPNNWGPCPAVPTNTNNVVIPNVATQPVISAAAPAATCQNLTINAGADLTINANRYLNVWGNVVNNGSAAFGDGTLTMEGTGTLTLTGNVNVGNYHVSTNVTLNGTVTVSNIARSEVGGALASNGHLVLEDGAQLLHGVGTPNGGGSVSGNIVVKRLGNGSGGYNAWSSPVVGGSIPGSNAYWYDSSQGTNSNADDNNPDPDDGWQAASGPMTNGVGYFSTNGGLATFVGVANNGSYSPSVTSSAQPLSSTTAPTFFNLIGNPYPSAIDADLFIANNSSRIDGALYFWSDENAGSSAYSSDDYATYSTGGSVVPLTGGGSSGSPNGSIPSCQGFFVNCDATGPINFNNGQRGGNNSQFFRTAAPNNQRMWLSINNDDLELFNQTLVAFSEDATDQKDWGVDAYKLRGNQAISIGAQQDGETYVIATYASIPQSGKVIPLMTYVETSGTYTFVADSMEGFQDHNVYLQDLSNGMLYPLQQGDSYSFAMTSNDEFGRFQLWFSPALVTGVDEAESVGNIYWNQNGGLIVKWNQSAMNTAGTIRLFDMSGREVYNRSMTLVNGVGTDQVNGLASGLYAAHFQSNDNQYNVTRKVVIGQ
ncbi:MAG: lamin tail domain-containing protein [Flavobacteriales bacterium]|nr:lamin tail domain-containing protein [Flavobacteriales bacterium]